MTEPGAALVKRAEGGRLNFRCPGCGEAHSINVEAGPGPRWEWNGSVTAPTLAPSILVRSGHHVPGHRPGVDTCWCDYKREHPEDSVPFSCAICHSFVRAGQIQFLDDCTHHLAGKTVPLPSWEQA